MKTSVIGLKEFRQNAEHYIAEVKKGKSFLVVKRSKPVFKIVDVDDEDEGNWETVIDFTKIRKGGIAIEELLSYL